MIPEFVCGRRRPGLGGDTLPLLAEDRELKLGPSLSALRSTSLLLTLMVSGETLSTCELSETSGEVGTCCCGAC